MSHLLSVDNLCVRFPTNFKFSLFGRQTRHRFVEAVSSVSVKIESGEVLALVGESGSGKTTLVLAMQRLIPIHAGTVRFCSENLAGYSQDQLKRFRREVAFILQDPIGSLSPRLTVGSLITEPFKIHRVKDCDLEYEATRLLKMVGLSTDFVERFPHQLSGGQARRVGIARSLALSPKLLIADEPTAGLDVSVQGEILNLLGQLREQYGISILLISHNLSIVRHVADRMAIMYLGRLIEEGDTETIFDNPRHPYSRALLQSVLVPAPNRTRNKFRLTGDVPSLFERPSGCDFHPRCPVVADRCRTEYPQAQNISSRHWLACHYPIS